VVILANWGKRLFLLESYGTAQALSIWVEEIIRAGAAGTMVDISDFVWSHTNGCSSDEYIYTLSKYMVSLRCEPNELV
jgi:hypothetical protein